MNLKRLYNELEDKKKKIAVIGLGYVGLPLLAALSNHFNTIGFDTNKERVGSLRRNKDKNNNIKFKNLNCEFISNEKTLNTANFYIIAVPTPIDKFNNPDLSFLKHASELVGKNMTKDSIVVYESTVYPGVTEEICIPILEKESKLVSMKDFYVGYSPERINPGDKIHTLENTVKIVSAQDKDSLDIISKVYKKIVKANIYKIKNIRIAEAAKVIENTQRDINIALVNELTIIFSKLGIDTKEVLKAAGTKWNFLNFYPGLVGGHCIGIDPYYLAYKAKEIGYFPEVINAGRRINDSMGTFIGEQILIKLLNSNTSKNLKVILFGMSFKENIGDYRNTKVLDIYNFLKQYNIQVQIYDPIVDAKEIKKYYGINLVSYNEINNADAVAFCVAHNYFKKIDLKELKSKMKTSNPYLFDIKWIFNKKDVENAGFKYWKL